MPENEPPKTTSLRINLEAELHREFKKACVDEDIPMSTKIVDLIKAFLLGGK